MSDVAFYHLQKSTLEAALPQLLEKTVSIGKRAVVMAGSLERVEALNAHLWDYDRESWLPHGSVRDGNAADQPVWLTTSNENPNDATFLFLTDGAACANVGDYERCFELFNGHDETAVSAARDRWKDYKEAGHALTYWQQNDRGRWEQKASTVAKTDDEPQ